MSSDRKLQLRLYDVVKRDPNYPKDAYLFCIKAVHKALRDREHHGHIRGDEIVEYSYQVARNEYGPMAKSVLQHWGILTPRCIGDIVFRLVNEGILSSDDSDRLEDFDVDHSLDDIFIPEEEYVFENLNDNNNE